MAKMKNNKYMDMDEVQYEKSRLPKGKRRDKPKYQPKPKRSKRDSLQ